MVMELSRRAKTITINHPGNFVPDTFFLPLAILPRTEYLNATDRLSSVSGFKRLPPVR
jgi:hypothetical protein